MIQVNRVVQMQQQGMSDNDIITTLKNEGVSPKDISDSLAQAKIKMAVSQEEPQTAEDPQQQQYAPQEQQYEYSPQQYPDQQYAPQEQQYTQEQYTSQEQQQYAYPEQSGISIETVTEIIDRIIAEKLKEINQKIKPVIEFKNKAEEDIVDLKERVKRIETMSDALQKAVIGKIGEFGQSTSMIHQDLENLHGTVSKLMNPLVDNYNELKKYNSKK
jgi:uncharacterized protein YfkK (UPF0435 family)